MKLWLLVNLEYDGGLDIAQRMVVRAPTERLARGVAVGEAGDEGSALWLVPERASCVELTGEGEHEAIAVVQSGF